MKRIRYTMPARSQGKLHMQRAMAELVEKDVHRRLLQRLNGFYCGVYITCTPHMCSHPAIQARDAVTALVEATGPNPRMSVCGWPFRSDDLGGVDGMERGMI